MEQRKFEAEVVAEVERQMEKRAGIFYEDCNVQEGNLVIKSRAGLEEMRVTMESIYEAYSTGWQIDQIIEELLEKFCKYSDIKGRDKLLMMTEYEKVREDFRIRCINMKKRECVLQKGIYRQLGDVVLGVYLVLSEEEDTVCMAMLEKSYLEKWGMTMEEVVEQAMFNTMKAAPPRFYDLKQLLLATVFKQCGGIAVEEYEPTVEEKEMGCFLSTGRKTNGAAAIFYPGVARKICEVWNTSSIYIVPTSIHEVAIHDGRYVKCEENLYHALQSMLGTATSEEDILSGHIFKYEMEQDKIEELSIC